MSKEKQIGAHKATTYFTKIPINPKWDATTLTTFSNKLAKYNVSIQAYQSSFETEPSVCSIETEVSIGNIETEAEVEIDIDDNSMDLSPSREDIISPPPPARPPRATLPPTVPLTKNRGFLTPPPPRSVKTLQRQQTQAVDFISTVGVVTSQKHMYLAASQKKTKNRIEPLVLPTSPFRSPRRDIPQQSQEYLYQNL